MEHLYSLRNSIARAALVGVSEYMDDCKDLTSIEGRGTKARWFIDGKKRNYLYEKIKEKEDGTVVSPALKQSKLWLT